jgi:hypothetical protein
MRLTRTLLALVLLVGAVPLAAQTITLDFERFPGPDGILGTVDDESPVTCVPIEPACFIQPLTTEFSAVGITFTAGSLHYGSLWGDVGFFVSSTPPAGTFSVPVRHVSVKSYSYWPATLTAWDAADGVLGSVTLPHPAPGATLSLGALVLTTTQPIARFAVTADQPGHILNLDDLVFVRDTQQGFFTLPPCRLVDTRGAEGPLGGPALVPAVTRDFVLAGACDIPATAKAVALNLVVTGASAPGNVRLFPGGSPYPPTSSINFPAGQTRSGNGVFGLDGRGAVSAALAGGGQVHLILDVYGYWE